MEFIRCVLARRNAILTHTTHTHPRARALSPGVGQDQISSRTLDREALQAAKSDKNAMNMSRTHKGHIVSTVKGEGASVALSYRVPLQASIDGNTVDAQMESAAFARNALEFGSSFRFLNGRFASLGKALSGN